MDRKTITAAYSAAKARLIAENRYDPDVFQDTWLECLTREETDFPERYRTLLADSYYTEAVFVHPSETFFLLLGNRETEDETPTFPVSAAEVRRVALSVLTDRQHRIFILKYSKGMLNTHIKDYLGVHESCVREALRTATKKIRNHFTKTGII